MRATCTEPAFGRTYAERSGPETAPNRALGAWSARVQGLRMCLDRLGTTPPVLRAAIPALSAYGAHGPFGLGCGQSCGRPNRRAPCHAADVGSGSNRLPLRVGTPSVPTDGSRHQTERSAFRLAARSSDGTAGVPVDALVRAATAGMNAKRSKGGETGAKRASQPGNSGRRAIIRTREGLGRLERARTPGPDPAGEPSAAPEEPVPP
jgi:hypothetical protein